jgi:hypothetical protein
MKTITFALALLTLSLSCSTPPTKQKEVEIVTIEPLESFTSPPVAYVLNTNPALYGYCGPFPRLQVKALPGFCVSVLNSSIETPRGISYYHHNGKEHLFVITGLGEQERVTHLIYGPNFKLETSVDYFLKKFELMDHILMGADQLLYISTKNQIVRFDPFSSSPQDSLEIVINSLPDKQTNEIRQFVFDEEGHLFVTTDNATKIRRYPRFENDYKEDFAIYFEYREKLTLNYDDENGLMMVPLYGSDSSMFYRAYMFPEVYNNSLFLLPANGPRLISLLRDNDVYNRENPNEIIMNWGDSIPSMPFAMATGPHGEIFVTDQNTNSILRISYHPKVKSINHLISKEIQIEKTCLMRQMPPKHCPECNRERFFTNACSLDQAKRYYQSLSSKAFKEASEIKNFILEGERLLLNLKVVNTESMLNVRTAQGQQICAKLRPESKVLVLSESDSFVEVRPMYKEDLVNDQCSNKYFVHKNFLK